MGHPLPYVIPIMLASSIPPPRLLDKDELLLILLFSSKLILQPILYTPYELYHLLPLFLLC